MINYYLSVFVPILTCIEREIINLTAFKPLLRFPKKELYLTITYNIKFWDNAVFKDQTLICMIFN